MEESQKIWFNGELVDWHEAKVHVLSHALHYGTSVFEGVRAYETDRGPAVFHVDEHLARFQRSAAMYYMDIPFTGDQLRAAIAETITANGLKSCYIRPLAFAATERWGCTRWARRWTSPSRCGSGARIWAKRD